MWKINAVGIRIDKNINNGWPRKINLFLKNPKSCSSYSSIQVYAYPTIITTTLNYHHESWHEITL